MKLILPAGVRAAFEPRIQGRTAGHSAVYDLMINVLPRNTSHFDEGDYESTDRPCANPDYMSGRLGWTRLFVVEFF